MKIGVKDYPNLEQEVLVGDEVVNADGFCGVVEEFRGNDILIKLTKGSKEFWGKDFVVLFQKK